MQLSCVFVSWEVRQKYLTLVVLPKRMDRSVYSEPWHCARTADVFYVPVKKKFEGKRARLQSLAEQENKVMTDRDRDKVDDCSTVSHILTGQCHCLPSLHIADNTDLLQFAGLLAVIGIKRRPQTYKASTVLMPHRQYSSSILNADRFCQLYQHLGLLPCFH